MLARTLKVAVPFVWFGMVLAISFMEAPLKFQAPGVDLPLGLGIGRLIFFALNKMEIACGVLLLFAFWRARQNTRTETVSFGLLLLIMVLETAWLLPILDARAIRVINGDELPFSTLHLIYIGLDAAKVVLLLVLGIAASRHYLSRAEQ